MVLSKVPMICAANIPAFFEPFNATVATGTPDGICKMERTESHPSIELEDLMGTPITGRDVSDATIPGKCAAPPAPAIITFKPLPGQTTRSLSFVSAFGVQRRRLTRTVFSVHPETRQLLSS